MSDSFVTPRAVARQARLSMGFPRQEYWSAMPTATHTVLSFDKWSYVYNITVLSCITSKIPLCFSFAVSPQMSVFTYQKTNFLRVFLSVLIFAF